MLVVKDACHTRLTLRTLAAKPPHLVCLPPENVAIEDFEEEDSPRCDIQCYYPVTLGDIVYKRYQITAKLGFGARPTVWHGRDLKRWSWQESRFVAINRVFHDKDDKDMRDAELETLRHITNANPTHRGYENIRTLLDSFYVISSRGEHLCLVFEPLRESLETMKWDWEDVVIALSLVKLFLTLTLAGLEYLHSECHIIHCDIMERNVIFRFHSKLNNQMLEQHAAFEYSTPLSVKTLPDRRVYTSHSLFGPLSKALGSPLLTDFDHSKSGDRSITTISRYLAILHLK